MGYTHYIKNKREFTDAEWNQFVKEIREMLDNTEIPIAGPLGETGTKPILNDSLVSFNGLEDDSHETAKMTKSAMNFSFCKTRRKPYDKLVVEMYKITRKILGCNVELSSDGGESVFE